MGHKEEIKKATDDHGMNRIRPVGASFAYQMKRDELQKEDAKRFTSLHPKGALPFMLLMLVALCGFGLWLSWTDGIGAALIVGLIFWGLHKKNPRLALGVAIACLALGAIFYFGLQFEERGQLSEQTTVARTAMPAIRTSAGYRQAVRGVKPAGQDTAFVQDQLVKLNAAWAFLDHDQDRSLPTKAVDGASSTLKPQLDWLCSRPSIWLNSGTNIRGDLDAICNFPDHANLNDDQKNVLAVFLVDTNQVADRNVAGRKAHHF